MKSVKFSTVDEYLSGFSGKVREQMDQLRAAILQAAPKAEEVISYNMPGFRLNGMLVWFAAAKQHIGFYPTNKPIEVFKEELSAYKTSKGAIQFPIEGKIPLALVKKIVKYRVLDNLEKEKAKAGKKKSRH